MTNRPQKKVRYNDDGEADDSNKFSTQPSDLDIYERRVVQLCRRHAAL